MDDNEIVDLYWKRNEQAIKETNEKYGAYCLKISLNILADMSDSEENVNDIAVRFGYSHSKIKSMLMRTRERLKSYLKQEGYFEE